jgi:hypothetical protein
MTHGLHGLRAPFAGPLLQAKPACDRAQNRVARGSRVPATASVLACLAARLARVLTLCCPPPPQDLPGALSDAQVAEGLGLTSIKSRDWSIFKTSGEAGWRRGMA